MSDIMHRSSLDLEGRQLINENDSLEVYNEIKEALRTHFHSFEGLLQKMGKPDITNRRPEAMYHVNFTDFEKVVRSLP